VGVAARRDGWTSLATGWAGRTLATAKAGASLGTIAAKQLVGRVVDVGSADDGDALADQLDGLKGLSMKLGQMASYMEGAVPDRVQRALARLQSNAQPMAWVVVEDALEEAYGDWSDVFSAFDRTPFAAASIGQVHRAVLDGREVAVKVQYPGIRSAIEVDLDNLGRASVVHTLASAVQPGPLLDELRARLLEECDYRIEAANQDQFRSILGGRPRWYVPEVRAELARERVLVTERIAGARPFDALRAAPDDARRAAAEDVWSAVWHALFQHGAFNGDPHPGNYLFADDRTVFLDFGCVRRFDADFIARWQSLARCVRDGDRAGFDRRFAEMGFVVSDRFDFDHNWEVMKYLYAPMREPGFRFTPAFVEQSIQLFVWQNPNLLRTRLPPEWLLLQRLQWGLYGVIGQLDVRGDFSGSFWDAVG
jgi:predicted unusual protein kinase regulating ubiquinone biosynthesis (AarF/ABC1/UbiB family)